MTILIRSTFRATAWAATAPGCCSRALGEYEVPDAVIKGGLCASEMFDLRPVLLKVAWLLCGALRRRGGSVLADLPHRANSQPGDVAYGDEESPTSSPGPAIVYPRSKRPGPHELIEPASTIRFEVVRRWPRRTAHSPARRYARWTDGLIDRLIATSVGDEE
jgi:hypothetical protein